jgi:RES domain-containing protein
MSRPHDIELVDALSAKTAEPFKASVFRATRLGGVPEAFSTSGGRWSPPDSYQTVPVLYTSLSRDGAISEVASYLSLLRPRPTKPIAIHSLEVTATSVVKLTMDELAELGVDVRAFSDRPYVWPPRGSVLRTQEIGAVLNFLEHDGLMVPSARWDCQNLIVFGDNHDLGESLTVVEVEDVDWVAWTELNAPHYFA